MTENNISLYNLPYPEEFYKSKKNKKSKILIIGAEHLLGWKLYEILKRDYSVIGIQEAEVREELENISLKEPSRLFSYIKYQQIQTIIISSECLITDIENFKLLKQIIDITIADNIKIIYVFLHNIIEGNNIDEVIDKLSQDHNYFKTGNEIKKQVKRGEENLVVELEYTYGFNGFVNYIDLSKIADFKENAIVRDLFSEKLNKIYHPILSDEVGLWLSEHITDKGEVKLDDSNGIFNEYWIEILNNTSSESNNNYCSYEDRDGKKFSNISEGLMIKYHQEKCIFNLIYKYSPHDYFKKINVGEFRYNLGQSLARIIPDDIRTEIDFVCPVPKTGMYYAMGLASELNLPYIQAIDKTSVTIRSFQIKNTDIRKEILWKKLRPIPTLLKEKNVAVVDEAIFTGTTLKVVCEMLRECGVNKILLCIPTPKCRYHCDYLMHPKRTMLLEYINDDMLKEYFDADNIFFQEDTTFTEVLKKMGDVCIECFLGRN